MKLDRKPQTLFLNPVLPRRALLRDSEIQNEFFRRFGPNTRWKAASASIGVYSVQNDLTHSARQTKRHEVDRGVE